MELIAYETPDCAHGAMLEKAGISVAYWVTMFAVGVGKLTSASGLQYLLRTAPTLVWSSEAEEPQL